MLVSFASRMRIPGCSGWGWFRKLVTGLNQRMDMMGPETMFLRRSQRVI
jgi:hypothetical protein